MPDLASYVYIVSEISITRIRCKNIFDIEAAMRVVLTFPITKQELKKKAKNPSVILNVVLL